MKRRTILLSAAALVPRAAWPGWARAMQATPSAEAAASAAPELAITLTDTGFEIAQPLTAGRYHVTVTNAGASTDSHFALGKIPDGISDAQYDAFLQSEEGTDDLAFADIAFVGVPDWPAPGGTVSGVIDLAPGRYLLFDPISGRAPITLKVDGDAVTGEEPASDVAVTLREMAFNIPEAAFASGPRRWKITNTGAMSHEIAILPVSPELTAEAFAHLLEVMMSLPEDATPPADLPEFVYQPVAAIGILAPRHTSWLDVDLAPGHYLAVCMLPFSTGYPHAIDGMYQVFAVK